MLAVFRPAALASLLALGACAVAPPAGPSVMVLPAKGKDFAAFQQEDVACRQVAAQQIGYGSPAQAATESAVNSAALGTVVGAAAGAVIGAAAGNPAAGAAIGAGTGLFVGGASGANAAQLSAGALQQRYDMSYVQCMYARGNSVPQMSAGAYPYYGVPYAYAGYPYPYYPPYYDPAYVAFGFGGDHFHHWRR